ncbi:hypothetical protein MY10362_008997 [Beauveria mimosiformis]
MKAALTILLAASLGSASPVGMQARDGQCDCSKSFSAGGDMDCPAGYHDTSPVAMLLHCTQIACSEGDFEAQCKANKSTPTPQCDCSKSFSAGGDMDCPAGYHDTSPVAMLLHCTQIACSEGDFEANCKQG